jgi:hypothetical protein
MCPPLAFSWKNLALILQDVRLQVVRTLKIVVADTFCLTLDV